MRVAIYVAAFLAVAAADPPLLRAILASAAGVVFECLPYVSAALIAGRFLPRIAPLLAFAGCGCASRASARSIPAALATALLFGPLVAVARVAAGVLAARLERREEHPHATTLARELHALILPALACAVITTILPSLGIAKWPAFLQFAGGAAIGAVASPCALGNVALAAALRASGCPTAAWGILCTAGIVTLARPRMLSTTGGDPWSSLTIALACALCAFERGAQLINPHLAPLLALCVPVALLSAWKSRAAIRATNVLPAALLLAAVVFSAPPPQYRATETTLADAFPGEHLEFTGVMLRDGAHSVLQRYAITCCRADAVPVTVALTRRYPFRDGTWIHASGTIALVNARLLLDAKNIAPITPPGDPFVYR